MGAVKDDLAQSFRQSQEKYVYYLIALNITAIGFVAQQTFGEAYRMSLLLLLLSVGSWLYGAYSGLKFLQLSISTLYANYNYLEIKKYSEFYDVQKNEIQHKLVEIAKSMEANEITSINYFNYMNRSLVLGVVLYMIWRVLELIMS